MQTIPVSEAKAQLLGLVRQIKEGGEGFIITLHGEPVARISSVGTQIKNTSSVAARMLARRKKRGSVLGELTIKQMIREGRDD